MSNATGDFRVIETTDVKKHEKNVDDSRGSFTLYLTGTAAG